MIGTELQGYLVNLKVLNNDDLIRRVKWMNDLEVTKLFTGMQPQREYLLTDAERWRSNTESDPRTIVWAIYTTDGLHIGDIDLHSINPRMRSAKLTILIGDKNYWNKGYGTDTINTVLKYAFSELKLSSVYLKVFEFNKRAVNCYKKCGFYEISAFPKYPSGSEKPNEIHMVVDKRSFRTKNLDEIIIQNKKC